MALMQLLSICYQKTFESAANPHKHWIFTILQLIPTRPVKSISKLFCIGDLIRRGFI